MEKYKFERVLLYSIYSSSLVQEIILRKCEQDMKKKFLLLLEKKS